MICVSLLILLLKAITVFATNGVDDLPDPKDTASMARYIVHNSNWTSISYISNYKETKGLPLGELLSVSDGPMHKSTGIPYFYVSRLQQAVTDLMDSNKNCSLMMSLAQTSICNQKHWDPQDPRCAHVVIAGTFHMIYNGTAEYETARNSVFTRHPTFVDLPENHHFFFAKLNITYISVQDEFGGPSTVSVSEYFKVNNVFPLYPQLLKDFKSNSNSNRNNAFFFTSLIILVCLLYH